MKQFLVVDWVGDVADEFDKEEDAVEYAKQIALEDSEDTFVYKHLATAKINNITEVKVK